MDVTKDNISFKQTIKLTLKNKKQTNEERMVQPLVTIFVSIIVYVAIVYSIFSMFKLKSAFLLGAIFGILVIFFLSYFHQKIKVDWKWAIMITSCFLVLFLLMREYIVNGLFLCLNQVAVLIGNETGIILHQYKLTLESEYENLAVFIFIGYFSILAAYIIFLMVNHRKHLFVWLIIIALFILQVVTKMTPSVYCNTLLFFAGTIASSYAIIRGNNQSKNSVIIRNISIVLILFVSCYILLHMIKPASDYTKNETVVKAKEHLLDEVEEFRYENNQTNTFTQGDFSKLGKLSLSESTALKVVMDEPTSLYLRGFVGSKYTDTAWKPLDNEVYYQANGLFYWLEKSGFRANNQLSIVNQMVNREEETVNITINNVNANSRYVYTPYELKTNPSQLDEIKTFDEGAIVSKSLFGTRLYSYQSSANLVTKYPSLANEVYTLEKDGQEESYFKNESQYNSYVYENYLQIPEDTKRILDNHLQSSEQAMDERMSYEQAISLVKDFVNEELSYNKNVKALPESSDFVQYVLEESKTGYATHYATVATLLFRYYGVPSRYVEGYLITPEDVKNIAQFEEFPIKGTNAHAWTEIYLDKVGWIPIEVTPPYYDVMEDTDFSNYPGGNESNQTNSEVKAPNVPSQASSSDEGAQQIKEEPQQQNNNSNQKPKEPLSFWQKVGIAVLLGFIVALLIVISYVLKGRMDVRKRNQRFLQSDYKEAIPALFTYTLSLFQYSGISPKRGSVWSYVDEVETVYSKGLAQQFQSVIIIHQQCKYSTHKLSQEQYNQVDQLMKRTLTELIQSKNWLQRLKMKYWDFIF
ncbi:hypothetical protein IEO70_03365 [Bacillus sp. AGMB 02131]|uniref:Transglutaminase-like domain-containing protein n=1 Tax=Peribacillus faecalis TaxID=2772559 RepID=A0A927HBH0_9BACI|nr:transglutaminase domain-containing protein [Peribacillus faecalis]MBD3107393.1 hypothetical protein [Peribacillus faecalis]